MQEKNCIDCLNFWSGNLFLGACYKVLVYWGSRAYSSQEFMAFCFLHKTW